MLRIAFFIGFEYLFITYLYVLGYRVYHYRHDTQTLALENIKLVVSYDLPDVVQEYYNRLAKMSPRTKGHSMKTNGVSKHN